MKPTAKLRQLLARDGLLIACGVYDALGAKIAEEAGYQAVYISGFCVEASFGYPDVGMISMTEFVDRAASVAAATERPVICDADTGFGNAVNVVRTVRELERTGVAGLHLEDQRMAQRSRSRGIGSKRPDLLVLGALPRAGPIVQRPKATRRATLPHQLPALCLKLLLQRHAPRASPFLRRRVDRRRTDAAAPTPPPAMTPCSHLVAIHPVYRNPESVFSDALGSRCLYKSALHARTERLRWDSSDLHPLVLPASTAPGKPDQNWTPR